MRKLALLLLAVPLLTARAAHAQDTREAPVVREAPATDTIAPALPERVHRDHYLGAGYGLLIGGLAGAGGLALSERAFGNGQNDDPGAEYLMGGVLGGVSGFILGALIGAPVRDKDARVYVAPGTSRRSTVVSVTIPVSW